jgi:hypothetical protein
MPERVEKVEKSFVSGNSNNGKSFQSFTVSETLLSKVVEAVLAGEKEARSTGNIQSFEVFYRGFRQNIAIGRIYVIPESVCNDRKEFPTALLYGCIVREFGGEEVGDMLEKRIGESEFDEYSQADFDTIKEKIFGTGGGKFASLILFAPSWMSKREYIAFKFTKDEGELKTLLRHQVFSVYFDPRLSSAFNAIMTNVNTTKVDVTDITPKLNFPFLAKNLLVQYPDLQKQAGSHRKKIFLTHRTADAVTKEVLDPQELDVFDSLDQALTEALQPGTKSVEDASEEHHEEGEAKVPRVAAQKTAHGYIAFYNNRRVEIQANTLWEAKQKAVEMLKVPKSKQGLLAVELAEKDGGEQVTTTITSSDEAFGGKQAPPFGSEKKEDKEEKEPSDKTSAAVYTPSAKAELMSAPMQDLGEEFNNQQQEHEIDRYRAILRNPSATEEERSIAQQRLREADASTYGRIASELAMAAGVEEDAAQPAAFETPFTNVGPGIGAHGAQESMVKSVKENVELRAGDPPVGIAIDENGVPRSKAEQELGKSKEACDDPDHEQQEQHPFQQAVGTAINTAVEVLPELLASDKKKKAVRTTESRVNNTPFPTDPNRLSSSYAAAYGKGGFFDKQDMPPQNVKDYINKTTSFDAQPHHAMVDHGKEIDAGKWGPNPTIKSAAQQVKADFIADHIAADFEPAYEASSRKTRKARDEREARLSKNRPKQAVSLDIDSIWDDIAVDFGPAPVVKVPGDGESDGETEKKTDGRPRKSDLGKLPEAMTTNEPEDDKALSDGEAEAQQDSMPEAEHHESQSEPDEGKWHVSSSMEEFTKEAFDELESDAPKYGCDQCQMLAINGFPTHEQGCPNGKKTWVPERGWVRYIECRECGEEVEEGQEHNCFDPDGDEPDPETFGDYQDPEDEFDDERNSNEDEHLSSEEEDGEQAVTAGKKDKHEAECDKAKDTVKKVKDVVKKAEDIDYDERARQYGEMNEGSDESVPPGVTALLSDPLAAAHEAAVALFEHGQWWLTCGACGAIWSVVDTNNGMDLEEVEPGNESCFQGLPEGTTVKASVKKADTADNPYNWVDGNGAPEDKKNAEKPMTSVVDAKRSSKVVASDAHAMAMQIITMAYSAGAAYMLGPMLDDWLNKAIDKLSPSSKFNAVSEEVQSMLRKRFSPEQADELGGIVKQKLNEYAKRSSKKKADGIQPDMAQARALVVSPDSVDTDIQQPTESVPEAAKVGASAGTALMGDTAAPAIDGQRYNDQNLGEGYRDPDVAAVNGRETDAYTIYARMGRETEEVDTASDEMEAQYLVGEYQVAYGDGWQVFSKKTASGVSEELAEARGETVSPDTVDGDIQQPTEGVEEAAKTGAEADEHRFECPNIKPGEECPCGKTAAMPGAGNGQPEGCPQCHAQGSDGCHCDKDRTAAAAPKPGNPMGEPPKNDKKKQAGHSVRESEMDAHEGLCPVCGQGDTEVVQDEESKHLFCHNCERVTWTFGLDKSASFGDNVPEEIATDMGAGDLAEVVMSEDEPEEEDDEFKSSGTHGS